jgi:hypothetical protein
MYTAMIATSKADKEKAAVRTFGTSATSIRSILGLTNRLIRGGHLFFDLRQMELQLFQKAPA